MENDKKRPNKVSKNLLVIAFIVLLICITVLAVVLILTRNNRDDNQKNQIVAQETQAESRNLDFGLKNMGELATQAGYFTNVQSNSSARQLFGMDIPFTESKYIYSYDGVVKAGMNFAEIDLDVNEITKTVTVSLPKTEILNVEIDNNSLKVYDEQQSIFTPLHVSDLNESQIELRKQVKQKAIDNGIIEEAKKNAKTIISGFLSGITDLENYKIQFKDKTATGH